MTINRFKWDLPIKIPAPEEKLEVRSLAWRLDEKIIAVAYNNGMITLVDVESKEEFHYFTIKCPDISMICWTQTPVKLDDLEKEMMHSHKTYLAPLPISNIIGNRKVDYNAEKFFSDDSLNFLLVATSHGKIHIYVYGILDCGIIDVAKDLNCTRLNLLEIKLSESLKELYVVYELDGKIDVLIYENETLLKNYVPLWRISVKYGIILNNLVYIEDTIQHITEAWEIVLLEMDKKLSKYAKKQPPGAVSADFLELLMFGYPSEALDNFLTHDLSERELKKLKHSVEQSYGTIQKFVVKPLHNAVVSLFYQINEIYGMHQNVFFYEDLLGESTRDAMMNVGAFLIKNYELQQTIDKSMKDYKIFFRWLIIAMARLLHETVSDDIEIITQQETNYLAEFLSNFEDNRKESVDATGEKEIQFNLERVGQYLADKNLVIQVNEEHGLWEDIFEENDCLKNHPMIFRHHKELSLIQQKNLMRKSITEVFGRLKNSIGNKFKMQKKANCNTSAIANNQSAVFRTSHVSDSQNDSVIHYFTVMTSSEKLLLFACREGSHTRTYELKFTINADCLVAKVGKLSFVDVKFYNSKVISLLLRNQIESRNLSCFMQLAISRIIDENTDPMFNADIQEIDLYRHIDDSNFKSLEGFNAHAMAVSGSRKVAAILSTNSKVIRLYDMEIDNDDDDEEHDTSSFVS